MAILVFSPHSAALHTPKHLHECNGSKHKIRAILADIPGGKYPVKEWVDAVRYIKQDNTLSLDSEQEARLMLEGK